MVVKKFSLGFVHIGLGKTGTSSIQSNLLKNQATLTANNIHFPIVDDSLRPFNGNHSLTMTSLFADEGILTPYNIKAGLNTAKKLQAANQQVLKEIYAGFAQTNANILLISAEASTHYTQKTISKMSAWLKEICNEIKIVACLRHPEDALRSEIQQQIKLGKTLNELYENPPISPISGCLQRHLDFYGEDNIYVYDFIEAINHQYGIVGAFLEKIGLNPEIFLITNESKNESLSQESVILLSTLNQIRPLKLGNKMGSKRFVRDRQLFFRLPGQKYQIPQHILEKSSTKINEELRWVKEKFGLEMQLRSNKNDVKEYEFSPETIESLVLTISDLQNKLERQRLLKAIKNKDKKHNIKEIARLKAEFARLT